MRSEKSNEYSNLPILAGSTNKALLETMPEAEANLLAKAQNPDARVADPALICLLEFYERSVIRYLARRLRESTLNTSSESARDAWLETIFRLTRRLHSPPPLIITPPSTLLAYMYKTAGSVASKILSDPETVHTRSLNSLMERLPDALAGTVSMSGLFTGHDADDIYRAIFTPTPGPLLEHGASDTSTTLHGVANGYPEPMRLNRDGRSPLQWALDTLPPDHRFCLIVHDWYGFTFAQIGETLDVAEGTAGFKAWVARNRVRALLGYIWQTEYSYSAQYIAQGLRIAETDVPELVGEGARLYARIQKLEMRGERDV